MAEYICNVQQKYPLKNAWFEPSLFILFFYWFEHYQDNRDLALYQF